MVSELEKYDIIRYKHEGKSNREIARLTGFDRDTVSKYWNEYCSLEQKLREPNADIHSIMEKIMAKPEYKTPVRPKRKYNGEIEDLLCLIITDEKNKTRLLGARHKQKLTNKQIFDKVKEAGHDIGIATVNSALSRLRKRMHEVFIRQEYELGQRLEYDFGEVRLDCGEGVKTHHMAVFCAPASGFRWLFLYTNQKKDVFMDSHVRFFDMVGGVWGEVVYDNMRNVVKKFIGRTEKELNPDLIKMSVYYGFKINVTNCFKGNEKGSVERSVDVLRNAIFADNIRFPSLEAAQKYAESQLAKMNEDCPIEDEKAMLIQAKPALELAQISMATVDNYCTISVDTVHYSIPEQYAGKVVTVKKYHNEIRIFSGNTLICSHKRAFGNGTYQVNIYHYLDTLFKKPGAVKNSAALRNIPKLKAIFDLHYATKPRKFIEIFIENRHLDLHEIIELFERKTLAPSKVVALDVLRQSAQTEHLSIAALSAYGEIVMGGVK